LARALKKANPKVRIVGADPEGSILGGGTEVKSYHVEGIGYDFFPDVLDVGLVDTWVKTTDAPSFAWARRAIREEGLLCGGSSGTALHAFEAMSNTIPAGSTCVILLPDGIRNYMTKMMDNGWLDAYGFASAKQAVPRDAAEALARAGVRAP
jgi:cysteine synthase